MATPIGSSKRALPVAQATDILLDSHKASLPRYQAYVRARNRFWEAFPGGLYTRLPTPGTDLECGFHALRLSMLHQLSSSSPSSSSSARSDEETGGVVDGKGIRIPTLEELREVFHGDTVARENERVDMANETWFTADQLAAVFSEWGRRFLGDQGPRCQLGYVTDDSGGMPVMMNTPWVETGETGDGILRVWVYNDGLSLQGGVGHFEGLRRPTPEEMQGKD